MMKNMITVRPDQTLEECLELMTRHQIQHLLVKEGEELIGNVSKHDVAVRIESVVAGHPGLVVAKKGIDGPRVVDLPAGELLPRIS